VRKAELKHIVTDLGFRHWSQARLHLRYKGQKSLATKSHSHLWFEVVQTIESMLAKEQISKQGSFQAVTRKSMSPGIDILCEASGCLYVMENVRAAQGKDQACKSLDLLGKDSEGCDLQSRPRRHSDRNLVTLSGNQILCGSPAGVSSPRKLSIPSFGPSIEDVC
jgi:hypothetical protein